MVSSFKLFRVHAQIQKVSSGRDQVHFYPFKNSVLFMGHQQTVKNPDKTPQNAASDQALYCLLT